MSTLAYAALTTRREDSPVGTSTSTSPPGLKTYVDAVAALVPAEVLTLHAIVLSVTTSTAPNSAGNSTTVISAPETLQWAFFGLMALSVVLYLAPRIGKWNKLDIFRALLPPSAFVAWTMLQRATAFDALWPALGDAPRTVAALFVAVVLSAIATILAKLADEKTPAGNVDHQLSRAA